MAELKPCPFCGGTKLFAGTYAEIHCEDEDDKYYEEDNRQYAVVCDYQIGGCGAMSGCCRSIDEAIEAWNRRWDNG